MTGLIMILVAWFSIGAMGAALAYRGSMRRYSKDIYGRPIYVATTVCGLAGFFGSVVAW